jgi:hypothetical protein
MPVPKTSVSEAASDGSRLDLLIAMRARVAAAVEDPNTPPRDLAALTRRLMEISNEIASIEAQLELAEDSVAAAVALADEPFDGTTF